METLTKEIAQESTVFGRLISDISYKLMEVESNSSRMTSKLSTLNSFNDDSEDCDPEGGYDYEDTLVGQLSRLRDRLDNLLRVTNKNLSHVNKMI